MKENIRLAFQGIWGHKMRSMLTMLGIIIGIAAIITIVSTIQGTNEQIKENLIGAGNNVVTVQLHENKNVYQTTRENLDLTREEASELLETVSPERIEKIENERSLPYPDEVLLMSDKYKQPTLCNYYCANQCPIGQQYVPEIKIKDLSQIVLETIASLNAMQKKKERLIEITVDGHISEDEIGDFVFIQKELEKISIAVETLQLWCERMLDTGVIDSEKYRQYLGE